MGGRDLQGEHPFIGCLRQTGIATIVLPTDGEYQAARKCIIYEPFTNNWSPSAVVKPATAEQVGGAVRCAAQFGATVSPRSGAHSFIADGCRGELIIDMSLHDMVGVATNDPTVVIFGAGQLHGSLYSKLSKLGLIVPGGTEAMVGVGGLWLGCGRGFLSQMNGISCDQVYAIQYVDANGNVEWADANWNQDMFWMARGSGGLFPGIVTKFAAQAQPVPQSVVEDVCYYPLDIIKLTMEVWLKHLDYFNDPNSKVFSGLHYDRFYASIDWNCWQCNSDEFGRFMDVKESIKGEINARSNYDGRIFCSPMLTFNMEQKLLSRGWDTYNTPQDFTSRPAWPEWRNIHGVDLIGSAYNGAVLVPNDYVIGDALLEDIATYAKTCPGNPSERQWLDYGALYPMKGRNADDVDPASTPYGGRGTKVVIHYKKDKVDADAAAHKNHGDEFERTLVYKHGLPCRGFYNYADSDIACAQNDDQWLSAFFSDPGRIRAIVQNRDPNRVFYRSKL